MLAIRTIIGTPLDQIDDRRGHRLPSTLDEINHRDRLLAEAAAIFLRGSSRAAARQLRRVLSRYAQGAWRRHCTEVECPVRLRDRIDEYLWRVLKVRDYVASERTIRAAIDEARKSPGLFVAHSDGQTAPR
jgi:hypothetical protein